MAKDDRPIVDTDEFEVDLSAVPDPDLLPAGRNIHATVQQIVLGLSKSGNKPLLTVTYMIDPSDYPVDYDPDNAPDGIMLSSYSTVSCGTPPKQPSRLGLSRWRKVYEKHGLDAPRNLRLLPLDTLAGDWGVPDEVLSDFVGVKVNLLIEHRDNLDGEPQANIKKVTPIV